MADWSKIVETLVEPIAIVMAHSFGTWNLELGTGTENERGCFSVLAKWALWCL